MWDGMVMVLPLHWEEEGTNLPCGRGRTKTMAMLPLWARSIAALGVIGVFLRTGKGREATFCVPFLYMFGLPSGCRLKQETPSLTPKSWLCNV